MKRLSLSEIIDRPHYLAEFSLPGEEVGAIANAKREEDGAWILERHGAPPFGSLFEVGKVYAIAGNGQLAEVKCVHREASSIHVVPVGASDRAVLESIKPDVLLKVKLVQVRAPDFLKVFERIEYQRISNEIANIQDHPNYDFTGKAMRSRLEKPDAVKAQKQYDERALAEEADTDAIEAEANAYRISLLAEVLEKFTAEDKARSRHEDELQAQILDLSRRQLECLAGLQPGELADMTAKSIQAILGLCNSDEDSPPVENPVEKKTKAKTSQKKESQAKT